MKDRFDNEVQLTEDEARLLEAVKALFSSKGDYAGAEFRAAFISAAMDGYCMHCGRGGAGPCYCTRDD